MLQTKRVPNSMIFAGDEGIGKRLFALQIAKSLVCQNHRESEACDICAACVRAEKFNFPKSNDKDENEKIFFSEHLDIGFLRPAGKFITVSQIRDLANEANFRPYEAKSRFFLIDNADKMNDASANALLKTLEEPSPTTHLFLITSRLNSLLQTIRSRCQIIRFSPLSTNEIETHLQLTKQFSAADAKLLSRLSRGSLGRALSLDLEKFRAQRETMFNALESLADNKNRAKLLRISEEMNDAKLKDEYETRLEILQTLIRDVWFLHFSNDTQTLTNQDLQSKLAKLAEKVSSPQVQIWLSEIELLRQNLAVNLNRKIATDALFMKMAKA